MHLALHFLRSQAASEISSTATMDKRPRKGGGYLQREHAEKVRKLEGTQPSGLARHMVPNFTASRYPTHTHRGMSLVRSLRAFMSFGIEVLWHFMALNVSTKFRTYLI